jgi:hypothetical protein
VDSVGRWSADPSVAAYWVRLNNLRGGRTYTGTIPLVPGDDAANATVVVEASDHVIWVLLVVLIGVIAGIGFRKWMNVGQTVSRLQERELLLGERFEVGLRELQAAGGPAQRLRDDIKTVRRVLEARLKELGGLLAKDAAGIEQAQKQLDELTAQADTIREVARAQKQLATTVPVALQVAGPAPPPEGKDVLADRPRLIIVGQGLLAGNNVKLGTLTTHRDALTAMHALLDRWIAVYQELRLQQAWIERLRVNATPEELESLKVQAAALRKVRWNLWDVADETDYTARAPRAAIDQVEEALRLIADRRISATPEARKIAATVDQPASAAQWAVRETSPADLPVPDQTEAAERVRHLRGLTDLTLGTAAFVVALITMLGTRYLDHPFGTLAHYGTALAWAFATTAGMDLIASGIASLRPVLARIAQR